MTALTEAFGVDHTRSSEAERGVARHGSDDPRVALIEAS